MRNLIGNLDHSLLQLLSILFATQFCLLCHMSAKLCLYQPEVNAIIN
jgi:hypothetical protein